NWFNYRSLCLDKFGPNLEYLSKNPPNSPIPQLPNSLSIFYENETALPGLGGWGGKIEYKKTFQISSKSKFSQ
ncbi:MAG: hypothetical protein QNJ53_18225, partial [Pleurocapsa sp. MO_192.B19]|nr:hypothetical protein [Pleurocapsa sp. MO_192.B19]